MVSVLDKSAAGAVPMGLGTDRQKAKATLRYVTACFFLLVMEKLEILDRQFFEVSWVRGVPCRFQQLIYVASHHCELVNCIV